MATKKEKRAAGEARAETHRANSIESGLQAQRGDQEDRQRKAMKIKVAAEKASAKAEKSLANLKKLNDMAPELLTTGS